jgi:hypothetical protein
VVDRVVRALMLAGGVLFVLGIAYGMWPVGDDCGSGFSPKGASVECAVSLAGRVNLAWTLAILGLGLVGGAFGFRSGDKLVPAEAPQEG